MMVITRDPCEGETTTFNSSSLSLFFFYQWEKRPLKWVFFGGWELFGEEEGRGRKGGDNKQGYCGVEGSYRSEGIPGEGGCKEQKAKLTVKVKEFATEIEFLAPLYVICLFVSFFILTLKVWSWEEIIRSQILYGLALAYLSHETKKFNH